MMPPPRSPATPGRVAHRQAFLLGLALLLLCGVAQPALAFPRPPYLGPPAGFTSLDTNNVRLIVQDTAAIAPNAFAVAYGPYLDRAYDELTTFLPEPPLRPELYVYATEADLQTALDSAGAEPWPTPLPVALVDAGAGPIALALPRLEPLSSLEAENTLRYALGQLIASRAGGGNLPPGFAEGIALYVERPVSARGARYAALLQNANRQNDLIPWATLNEAGATAGDDPALVAAHNYAIVAFLADHFGLYRLNEFVTSLRQQPDWQLALRETYQRSLPELEAEWHTNLPRWTATGWQTNLFAAFDLQLARDLLANAHYAAAKEEIGKSLRLATELRDPEHLAEAEALLRQSDIGLQAESLMTQIQASLEAHTYGRAQDLITQARLQFAQLPPTQNMDALLTSYDRITTQGLQATADLARAGELAPIWTEYPEARSAALGAGVAAANLGDEAIAQQAQNILTEIDARQRRIVYMLIALTVMCFAWLAFWGSTRGRAPLQWNERLSRWPISR